VLPLAARIGETQVDIFDVIILDRLKDVLGGLHVLPSLEFLGRSSAWRERRQEGRIVEKSDGIRAGFAGPNADRFLDMRYKYLAIPDAPGLGGFADRLDGRGETIVGDHDLDFHLG
jgi:hypothetical protein